MTTELLDRTGHKPLFPRLGCKKDRVISGPKSRAQLAIEGVKAKIAGGKYDFEDTTCFCGRCNDTLVSEVDRYEFYHPMVICNECGLMRANPRMTREAYSSFYKTEYRDVYGEGDGDLDELFRIRQDQARARYLTWSAILCYRLRPVFLRLDVISEHCLLHLPKRDVMCMGVIMVPLTSNTASGRQALKIYLQAVQKDSWIQAKRQIL